jgi:hypothetical protein
MSYADDVMAFAEAAALYNKGMGHFPKVPKVPGITQSDGSTASYYELPRGATELQDLISHRNMNAQIGEIFRACYRYGLVAHSPMKRDIKKIIFYAQAELKRLEKMEMEHASQQEAQSSSSEP